MNVKRKSKLDVVIRILLIALVAVLVVFAVKVVFSAAKTAPVAADAAATEDKSVIGEFQAGTYGGIKMDTAEDAVKYYVEAYNKTKAETAEFNTPEGVQKAAAKCRELGIDGVVVVGGDGSFRGARDLTGAGVPCIGVPGTIDNDISSSEYTIGYDTAMNTAMEMIDRIRDTTESHDRCSVVEVMGRRCGDIALNTGIAVGAIATLVPEVKYDFEKDIIERIRYAQKTGKRHFIVVVAEGVGHSEDICKRIQEETGIESRATILGHVQRGGSPTLRDRVVASQMGYHAVELLRDGKCNRVVVMQGERIVDFDITEALEMPRVFDEKLYKISQDLSR